tara:strand:- start:816 stop:1085 length:270 start_codon:yes stop_codon:yes gene_type:complete
MKDKPISLQEYIDAGEEFFPKYYYVAGELGEDAKAEDILKIMESLAGVAMKKRFETKVGPFGFNKQDAGNQDGTEETNGEDQSGSESND